MSVDDDAVRRFDEQFAAHYSEVFRYVVRRAPLSNAEDALAETFLVAWRRADQMPDDSLPWLLGVARRVLANQRRGDLRRQALSVRLKSTWAGSASVWEPPDGVSPELAGALASLSERERDALLLTAWDGLEVNRAARAAGCSAAAFRVRLH
ncbi:MAG: RNA polymerase sigma factor, partial [Solirubrobacteraceae bacterium]